MATKKRAGRTPLTPARVLETALKLADKKGLDWLSMRNLAQALKVEAMSLYNHVPSKEHILDGIVDLVAGEIAVPRPGGDWKAAMRERAQSAHGVLMRHPWATLLFVSRLNIGPNMLRYVDATIGCLRAGGFTYPQADYAWNALDAYIYGFTLQRLNFPLDPDQYAAAASKFLPMIPPERFPYLNGMSQEVVAGRHDGVQHLELGLDILLDGLERMRKAG
ncbi:TetR/AcrR family transcriptional regulator [Pyxidicoccus trucidator]|uniref:TetR/AcrR family transcriptional regulator n=1 Tax=Pyxidicoccus trucidator TaxID=2709662 RepID=UPI0013DB7B0C|nr:TetR/AcrR family transcriptional regulator [Pyxidicoccus trucidator]